MKKSYLLLLSTLFLFSCASTVRVKTQQKRLNRQAEGNADNVHVVNKPVLADLEVGTLRMTAVYKTTSEDILNSMVFSGGDQKKSKKGFLTTGSENMKQEAINRAQFYFMEQSKCDYLVDPIYKVETEHETSSEITTITVTVSAFPATFKKFSQPDSLPKSVFQGTGASGRELPLLSYSHKADKEKMPSETGVIGGLWLGGSDYSYKPAGQAGGNNFPTDATSSVTNGLGMGAGIYHIFSLGGHLGIRLEGQLGLRSYSSTWNYNYSGSDFYTADVKTSFVNFEIPVMFDYKLGQSNLHVLGGYMVNYTLSGKNKSSGSVTSSTPGNNISYAEAKTSITIGDAVGTGIVVGAYYKLDGGLSIGLRYKGDQLLGSTGNDWTSFGLQVGYAF